MPIQARLAFVQRDDAPSAPAPARPRPESHPRSHRVRQAIRSALAGVALAVSISTAALADSATYTVQPGDTLNGVAARHGVSARDLRAANDIHNPDVLQVGQVLRLPDSDHSRAVPSARGEVTSRRFVLPIRGPISTYFGEAGPLWRLGYHPGLDIAVPVGTPIRACGEGVVIEAESVGSVSGYGHYVKVDHGDGLHSLYAHMSTVSVRVGDRVGPDTVLGYVGMTGVTTGPHLHWEIRQDGVKKDPLAYVR